MIKERYQFQARRLDNGNLVTGLPVEYSDHTWIMELTDFSEDRVYAYAPHSEMWSHRVDPSTIEPVAVAVLHEPHPVGKHKCPNCKAGFFERPEAWTPFCGNCGQRLDWSNCDEQKI